LAKGRSIDVPFVILAQRGQTAWRPSSTAGLALLACLLAPCAAAGDPGPGLSSPRPFSALFQADEPAFGAGDIPPASAEPGAEVLPAGALPLPLLRLHLPASAFDQPEMAPAYAQQPSITWGPLLRQSFALLTFQHWFRATFEDGTWAATTEGPFWDDYVNSVKGLCCWDDGDKGTTNWLFHPMLGSAATMLFANNHADSQRTPLGNTRAYWGVKGKQFLFATAYSTYFELGPVLSEAAIGNVGLDYSEMTWLDLVVTPILGTGLSIGEDLLRKYVIAPVDRRNHFFGAVMAIFLNPTRSFVNLFALRTPWADPEWLPERRVPRYGR
jgi:hypothetical protein